MSNWEARKARKSTLKEKRDNWYFYSLAKRSEEKAKKAINKRNVKITEFVEEAAG